MCDPVLLAAILCLRSFPRIVIGNPYYTSSYFDLPVLSIIEVLGIDSPVAISFLFLKELGYFDEKKDEDRKDEIHNKEINNDNSKNSGEE